MLKVSQFCLKWSLEGFLIRSTIYRTSRANKGNFVLVITVSGVAAVQHVCGVRFSLKYPEQLVYGVNFEKLRILELDVQHSIGLELIITFTGARQTVLRTSLDFVQILRKS